MPIDLKTIKKSGGTSSGAWLADAQEWNREYRGGYYRPAILIKADGQIINHQSAGSERIDIVEQYHIPRTATAADFHMLSMPKIKMVRLEFQLESYDQELGRYIYKEKANPRAEIGQFNEYGEIGP